MRRRQKGAGMIQIQRKVALRRRRRTLLVLALHGVAIPASAVETHASGRITVGEVLRTESSDPVLLTTINAAAIGLTGKGSGGNADDGNTNYRHGDAASRAVKAWLDLSASEGETSALLRLKAWRDIGLLNDARPWGNVPSAYAADAPLSDRGAARLTRFSGLAVQEAWVQQRARSDDVALTLRLGQQNLSWGERFATPGGLEALNPRDLPALHRAGAAPQETKVAMPMLFGRIEAGHGVGIEAYYQTSFRSSALDMCGTLWSLSDYQADGCDKVMSGLPAVSDRARLPLGAYMKRLPTPKPGPAEFGIALTWKPAPGTELGLYHAHYNARSPLPSLRRTSRPAGPALIAGDPDGRNMAFFTEYPEGLVLSALSFVHKSGAASWYGEMSYRPRAPYMLSPGDVLPPFLSPTAPAMLRASADAVAPGGVFHGFDLHGLAQAQLGVRRDFRVAGMDWTGSAEVVAKHTPGLPDPALRRYGRADIFGVGPVLGNCAVTTADPGRQCSLRGYTTADAYAYRLRLDASLPPVVQGLVLSVAAGLAHDVRGWSGDLLINEGRKTASLALRARYLQRYVAEVTWLPNWGGDYNQVADRDTLALSVGIQF
jgi:hypothetical protein